MIHIRQKWVIDNTGGPVEKYILHTNIIVPLLLQNLKNVKFTLLNYAICSSVHEYSRF